MMCPNTSSACLASKADSEQEDKGSAKAIQAFITAAEKDKWLNWRSFKGESYLVSLLAMLSDELWVAVLLTCPPFWLPLLSITWVPIKNNKPRFQSLETQWIILKTQRNWMGTAEKIVRIAKQESVLKKQYLIIQINAIKMCRSIEDKHVFEADVWNVFILRDDC